MSESVNNLVLSYLNFKKMTHRGEILRIAIDKSGKSVTKVCDETNIFRGTLYKVFKQADPSLEYFVKIGPVINHDFSKEIPELAMVVSEPQVPYNPTKSQEVETVYMFKYYDILEKYLALLETVEKLKAPAEAEPSAPKPRQKK